jgi:hypothetical protein
MKHLLLLSVVWLFAGQMHPVHVSVCDMEYKESLKAIQATHRIFIDDLETGIKEARGWAELDLLEPEGGYTTDQLVSDYLAKHFTLSIGGKVVPLSYLGHEVEGETLICYMEATKVKPFKEITVTNSILLDTFRDQANLVHLKVGGKTKSLKMDPKRRSGVLKF